MTDFETTRWSLVLAAGGDDSSAASHALATLCEAYWYPLYAYLRRRGESIEDARDLTQGFLASLLARRGFDHLSPDRGRFRAFLMASLKHFVANEAAARRAARRGGGQVLLPLDAVTGEAERRYTLEPVRPVTPETLFERRWALILIDRVLGELRARWEAEARGTEFDRLKACLLGDAPPGGYDAVARELGTTAGAVKVAVHRLRRRFRTELHRQIAETVADPADVDDELRHLIRALGA
jgi:RNA polymerase sigma-70 factor (ECF subfamily)